MAQNVNPTFVKTPNLFATSITTGNTASQIITLMNGGANGSKVTGLVATANTTSTFDVRWGVSSGGTQFFLGTGSVPTTAGIVSATPPANLMATSPLPIDSDGNQFIFLPSSAYTLFIQTTATSSQWTAASFIYVTATSVGDF